MRTKAKRLLLIFAFALFIVVPASTQIGGKRAGKLSPHDRDLLSEARVQGKPTLMLMIAAAPGASSAVAAGIQRVGGVVRSSDTDLSYVRAVVPINYVENVAGLAEIEAVKLDELLPLDDPKPEGGDTTLAVPPPGPTTPPLNPYMPTEDLGAPQFVQANPTYDGRGVKIAIVDTGIDLLTPELQTAKLSDGTPTRKVVDWVNFNDPLSGIDPSWVNMETQVSVIGGTFLANLNQYTGVAADGVYRFGIFSEANISPDSSSNNSEYAIKVGTMWCADLNRNGVCHESFAVLWRTSDNTVWVDSNADKSFADETGMKDYRVKYDIGLFGTDNPATTIRESVPFVVATDGKDKYVNIGVVGGAHATHVAGIAAGKDFFGGEFDGVAPEAQLISVRVCLFYNSCTTHGMLEGMIYAAKEANADVINMSIGGLPALNDGNGVFGILYNRLIEQTKAQMFISAGNSGPGTNTVGDPSVVSNVMSVGAYVTQDTWYYNYGVNATVSEGLFAFSSRGPAENGGFKPNIVAPGCAISSVPGWQAGQPVPGTYPLPPGYGMFNGTSMASPMATGSAALLISAANQTGVQHKPEQLRQAMNSSARFLAAYGAHEQGNGLLQVSAAWNLLRTNIQSSEISSSAPVNTVLSNFLAVPGSGPGIYQREGWQTGDQQVLNVTFTRTKGTFKPQVYSLSWVGNDGTFTSANTISLPREVPVVLPVTVHPTSAGVHSAILNLAGAGTSGYDYQLMNTVVAAEQITLAGGYSIFHTGSAQRSGTSVYFYNVPPNVPFLTFDLTPLKGSIRLWAITPQGVPFGYLGYYTGPRATVSGPIQNPLPGTWEVTMETSPSSLVTPATFSAGVTLLGGSVSPQLWTINEASVGTLYANTYGFTNDFAMFTGAGAGSSLASVFKARPTIGTEQALSFDIIVPPGSSSVSAGTSNPSDPLANINLYLYDCTAGPQNCILRRASLTSTANESVTWNSPTPGLWRVVVAPYLLPSGTTSFDYIDMVNNSQFGYVSLLDSPTSRPIGAFWQRLAMAKANLAPDAGRFLQGFVYLRTSSGYPIGSAEVNLKF